MSHQLDQFDLGILFVHGIGDQTKGSTLTEFGNPFVEWLASRAKELGGTVKLDEVHITAGDEPSRAEVTIEIAGQSPRKWLLAEAWWAEAFQRPSFSQFAVWSLAIAPRAFGTHFGLKVRRVWTSRKQKKPIKWIGDVAAASLSLGAGLVGSIVIQIVMSILLLIGVIPWQVVRNFVVRVQLKIAAYLGDSYVLIDRPLEAAAILTKFRDDFDWIKARSKRTAVIGHSQGAAVACRGLVGSDARTDLLITFGSGLRKLEEQSELRARQDLRDGAGWTLLGFVWTLIGAIGIVALLRSPAQRDFGSLFILPYLGIGIALLAAGLRDFVSASDPQGLRDLRELLPKKTASWLDVYASNDPVPNGSLYDDGKYPQSEQVVNSRSAIGDHVGYWGNRDEFVSVIGNAIVKAEGSLPQLALPEKVVHYIRALRTRRVGLLLIAKLMTLALIVAAVCVFASEWKDVARWTGSHIMSLTGYEPAPKPLALSIWRQTAGVVAGLLAIYGVVFWAWYVWNVRVIANLPPKEYDGLMPQVFAFFMAVELVAGASIIAHGNPPNWLMTAVVVTFIPFAAAWMLMEPEKPAGFFVTAANEKAVASQSKAVRVIQVAIGLFGRIVGLLSLPFGAYLMIRWAHDVVNRWLPPSWFNWVIAALALIVTFFVAGVILAAVAQFVKKRSPVRPAPPAGARP